MPILGIAVGAFLIVQTGFEWLSPWPVGTHVEPNLVALVLGLGMAGVATWDLKTRSRWAPAAMALVLVLSAVNLGLAGSFPSAAGCLAFAAYYLRRPNQSDVPSGNATVSQS